MRSKGYFYLVISLLLIIFMYSCNNNNKRDVKKEKDSSNSITENDNLFIETKDTSSINIEERIVTESSVATTYSYEYNKQINCKNPLETQSSYYTINNKKENLLNGEGLIVYIPRDCFVLENEKIYTGDVKIELKKIQNKQDFIFNNLQTSCNDKLLETGGVVYIDAQTNDGRKLKIKAGESIYIESSSKYSMYNSTMQKFYGAYDDNNQMKWEFDGDLEKQMIIIPFEYIEYKGIFIARSGERWDERVEIYNDLVDNKIKIKKFENTFISTREFAKRFPFIFSLTDDYYYDNFFEHTTILFDFYLDNTDKDLWYCDSLLLDKILLDKDRILKEQINPYKYKEVQKESFFCEIKRLQDYVSERRTKPIIIKNYGIDLSQKNALEMLLSMGISEEEAKENIKWFTIQQSVIKELIEERNANYLNYAFKVNKLGWINIDMFFLIPKNEQRELIVECNNKNEDELKCFLSFTQRNSVLSENLINNKVCFNYLPTGDTVNVFVYGYRGNNKACFGYSKAITGKDYNVNVSLEEITIEELKAKLEDLI
jgi:hypothetical protein